MMAGRKRSRENFGQETAENQQNKVKAARPPITGSGWKKASADFLSRVPATAEQWRDTKVAAGLPDPQLLLNTFRTFSPEAAALTPGAAIRAYGVIESQSRKPGSGRFNPLYNYSRLLFFCVCAVARENGTSLKDLDNVVQTSLGDHCPSSKYSSRLRTAACWAARLIEKLESTLGHLASALFLLCGPAMETYRQYTTGEETTEYLILLLKLKAEGLLAELQAESRTERLISFSPTFIITYAGPWCLRDVNKALRTDLSEEEYAERVRILHEADHEAENALLPGHIIGIESSGPFGQEVVHSAPDPQGDLDIDCIRPSFDDHDTPQAGVHGAMQRQGADTGSANVDWDGQSNLDALLQYDPWFESFTLWSVPQLEDVEYPIL